MCTVFHQYLYLFQPSKSQLPSRSQHISPAEIGAFLENTSCGAHLPLCIGRAATGPHFGHSMSLAGNTLRRLPAAARSPTFSRLETSPPFSPSGVASTSTLIRSSPLAIWRPIDRLRSPVRPAPRCGWARGQCQWGGGRSQRQLRRRHQVPLPGREWRPAIEVRRRARALLRDSAEWHQRGPEWSSAGSEPRGQHCKLCTAGQGCQPFKLPLRSYCLPET